MEQRSPEWFAARKNRITGSAVGAILGLSPYSTPDDVMRRMVREKFDAPSEFTGNVATEWGVANEAGAIKEYEMETGVTVKPAGFYTHMHWLGASPDGLVGEEGLIEVKCPYSLRHEKSPVPFKPLALQMHYYAQIQIQLFITGRPWCHFYQWTPAESRKGESMDISTSRPSSSLGPIGSKRGSSSAADTAICFTTSHTE